ISGPTSTSRAFKGGGPRPGRRRGPAGSAARPRGAAADPFIVRRGSALRRSRLGRSPASHGGRGHLSDGAVPDRARAAVLGRGVGLPGSGTRCLAQDEGEDVVAPGGPELVVPARGDEIGRVTCRERL